MRTTDERAFVAGVMSEIRSLVPADRFWWSFARWALPALALSFGGLLLSVQRTLEEGAASAQTILLSEHESLDADVWLSPQEADA